MRRKTILLISLICASAAGVIAGFGAGRLAFNNQWSLLPFALLAALLIATTVVLWLRRESGIQAPHVSLGIAATVLTLISSALFFSALKSLPAILLSLAAVVLWSGIMLMLAASSRRASVRLEAHD